MFKDNELGYRELTILVLVAYLFSFVVRLIWVFQFQDNPNFYWNDQLMINTNDGYFFASAVDYLLTGVHADNPRVGIAIDSYPGMVYASYFLAKFTPMSLETAILYAPSIFSSLVVIPIILTGKLIKLPWVGFFAALLGSIVWSYYNRTMTGYYDSDMFSVLLQFTVLYLFLLTLYSKKDRNVLWLAFFILIYPLFYPQGLSLLYAIFFLWVIYQLIFQRDDKNSYLFTIVASVSLWAVPVWSKIVIILFLFIFIEKIKNKLDIKKLFYLTLFSLLVFLLFGDVFMLIISKIMDYTERGVQSDGLHFYQVIQTVREAGSISWETVANRVVGGTVLLILSIIGYIILVIKHKQFLIALPLIGIGVFAHWAGLRFTVYAVPVAAFSIIYLFYMISSNLIKQKQAGYALFVILSLLSLYPNITHIIGYKVPTVLNKTEVQDLEQLNKIADSKDYTLSWWDYGYPIWFYSDTSTLIDGAKHNNDNFIISKLMFSTSPDQVANLSRLAVETYVDSNYSIVANKLFENKNPNSLLDELKSNDFKLPKKRRDVYLYLPFRMMRIFPTVGVFGNINLKTGKPERTIHFYPTAPLTQNGGKIMLQNGIIFDSLKGEIEVGGKRKKVQRFDIATLGQDGISKVQSQLMHIDGDLCVVFLQSYGQMVVMDRETYNSTYVQMFMLGKYDKDLFELVVSSPYSKIYKVKK